MTVLKHLVVGQGSTFRLVVNVLGGPTTLENYTGRMQVRKYRNDPVVLLDLTSDKFVVNHLTRQVVLTIPSAATENAAWSAGVYDLNITGPSGDRWRLLEGNLRLSRSVTREG